MEAELKSGQICVTRIKAWIDGAKGYKYLDISLGIKSVKRSCT